MGHLLLAVEVFTPNTFMHYGRSMQYTWLCPVNFEASSGLYDWYSQSGTDDIVIDSSTLTRSPVLNMTLHLLYGESPLLSPPTPLTVTAGHYASIEFVVS